MDNNESPVEDQLSEPENGGIGIAWKIIIAVVAVAIIAFAASSLFRGSDETPATTGSSEITPPTVPAGPAQADENQALQSEATSAEAYFQQGNDYVQAGQLPQAVSAYQKAIELDPDYQAVYANLGVVYYQLEQLDLAAQQYEKALELDPQDGEVTYNLGALNLQRALIGGNQPNPELLSQAVSQLEHALELSPGLAEPFFSLGVAHLAQGDEAKAIEAFESFLEKDSGNDPRASQEARRYLDTLKSNN